MLNVYACYNMDWPPVCATHCLRGRGKGLCIHEADTSWEVETIVTKQVNEEEFLMELYMVSALKHLPSNLMGYSYSLLFH